MKRFTNMTLRAALALGATAPMLANACMNETQISSQVDQTYQGIASLPVRRILNLDESCNGRELKNITLWASSSDGGRATLIVNGIPVGVTQIISNESEGHVFNLNSYDPNLLGQTIHNIEIRLSGTFHVEHLDASLGDMRSDSHGDRPELLGTTATFDSHTSSDEVMLTQHHTMLKGLLIEAIDADFQLDRITIFFSDGRVAYAGPAYIEQNSRRAINFGEDRMVDRIEVRGYQGQALGSPARLQIYGI